jgi:RNA polymerase sigma-70 factor, ECF subfamily
VTAAIVSTSVGDALEHLEEPLLVERAKHDRSAFGELYRRHHGPVFRFAYSRLRNEADAEDVTADVFLRALRSIGRYQDRGIPFHNWLFQIAANAVVDHVRGLRPVEDLDEHPELAAPGSLEQLVAERDQVRRIGQAARELPARQRQAFALRLGHDMKADVVARRMGRSQGAVKLLVHRAVRGVRAALPAEDVALELAS